MTDLVAAVTAPMYALPLDAFRVLAGIVSFAYFGRTLLETTDFSGPDGLIDHRLAHRLLPPTRLGFFHPGIPEAGFRAVFALACVASLFVVAGYQVNAAALFLFLVAVSTYRWNMLVTYVDDAIMHLVLFWLIVLPVGTTLTLPGWLREGNAAFDAWTGAVIPGGATRLFLVNLAIAYFVAGVYKWTSPMWLNGTALYAILKLPIAFRPDGLEPRHLPLLRTGNHVALAIEPLFPLMLILPSGSGTKWFVVAGVAGFHLGIVATLRIPFANLAMLGALPIFMHDEIMLGGFGQPTLPPGTSLDDVGSAEFVALALVGAIALMLLLEVRSPPLRPSVSGFRRNPARVALWLMGIAQSYRLFDWIDVRNYHASYEAWEWIPGEGARRIDATEIFPRSIRHLLLQSYLHGSIWHQLDPAGLREARRSILERYARRWARQKRESGTIEVVATWQRVTSDNLSLQRGVRRPLLRFSCRNGEAVLEHLSLDPEEESTRAIAPTALDPSPSPAPPSKAR